jgi:hypothetical protein
MNEDRSEIMEKARAKRRRKTQSASKASHKRNSPSTDATVGLTEKVLEVAQDAAAQVGAFVKAAAATVSGARDDKVGQGARKRPSRR